MTTPDRRPVRILPGSGRDRDRQSIAARMITLAKDIDDTGNEPKAALLLELAAGMGGGTEPEPTSPPRGAA